MLFEYSVYYLSFTTFLNACEVMASHYIYIFKARKLRLVYIVIQLLLQKPFFLIYKIYLLHLYDRYSNWF